MFLALARFSALTHNMKTDSNACAWPDMGLLGFELGTHPDEQLPKSFQMTVRI